MPSLGVKHTLCILSYRLLRRDTWRCCFRLAEVRVFFAPLPRPAGAALTPSALSIA